jgi:hypothetical protein
MNVGGPDEGAFQPRCVDLDPLIAHEHPPDQHECHELDRQHNGDFAKESVLQHGAPFSGFAGYENKLCASLVFRELLFKNSKLNVCRDAVDCQRVAPGAGCGRQ